MKMIVGLGNIGAEFDNTPHNVGFRTIDRIVDELGLVFKKKMKDGLILEAELEGCPVLFVKPLTFMNNSGDCVFALAKKFSIKTQDICVVLDDVDLTAGLCRIRPSGSAGTHNGLKSVTLRLGTTEFYRIRIGVDYPGRTGDLADYVLSKMRDDLANNVEVGIDKAVKYVKLFAKGEELSDTK